MQYNNTNMYQSYVSFCIGHIKKYINNIMKPNTHSGDSVAKIFGRHKRDIQRKIAIANGFGQKRNNFVITANSFEYAKVLLESGDEKKFISWSREWNMVKMTTNWLKWGKKNWKIMYADADFHILCHPQCHPYYISLLSNCNIKCVHVFACATRNIQLHFHCIPWCTS